MVAVNCFCSTELPCAEELATINILNHTCNCILYRVNKRTEEQASKYIHEKLFVTIKYMKASLVLYGVPFSLTLTAALRGSLE